MMLIRENKEGAYLCMLCISIPLSVLYLHNIYRGITIGKEIFENTEATPVLAPTVVKSRFKQRWELLQAKCIKNKDPQLNNINQTGSDYWPTNSENIMIDERSKLMGCLITKSGSSSWHKMFWDLRLPGIPVITGFGESNFAAAKTLSSDVWVQAMNDNSWIRFISVRHPLARLYSGWNSNLSRSNKNAAAMSKEMALQQHVRKQDPEHWINWSDFLLFMSEEVQKPTPNINGHFLPTYPQCHLCETQFNYIVKIETINDDAKFILSMRNGTLPDLEHRNEKDDESIDIRYSTLYQNVDYRILKPILAFYKQDMEYLGYGYNSTTGRLMY